MTAPRFFSAEEIDAVLGVGVAIESQRRAFVALGRGDAVMPPKTVVEGGNDGSLALTYSARLSPEDGPVCKFVSFNPGNAARGLPSIHGLITVLHPETGVPVAVLDGAAVTTSRTSAASAVAADVLANPDAGDLAVIGCGAQGKAHVRAIAAVRGLRRVRMFARDEGRRKAAAEELDAEFGFTVEAAPTVGEAVEDADLVALCTVSAEPVLRAAQLAPGCTVLAVGSFEPHRREADRSVLAAATTVTVDHAPTAIAHAGPVIDALSAGVLREQDIVQLGDVLLGKATGRVRDRDIVFYNSTGVGVQDAAAALAVVAHDAAHPLSR
ncbi:ornithine cyclodeaminase family protein [Amycolatopsis sp. CA-230715]|uniref:ornithine cyclodeaminase family protein n=1 Tax=Amycolatopsis sp. CA-230715 TaxID=2745196 RepID=UPI001C0267BC|nr:ornithine cyclodeaminase family protein [Amycolatopsis sp. CA-230715]QWF82388.1 Alanine dehydrogenase [Amycolatopsis sp. CA-230715]